MEETKEAAAKVAQAEAAAAATELEQAQLAAVAATTAVSLTGEQVGGEPATSDCSAMISRVLSASSSTSDQHTACATADRDLSLASLDFFQTGSLKSDSTERTMLGSRIYISLIMT